jgi:VIT1/CCC1 family predicted Fe2+/Mn2+ transporter
MNSVISKGLQKTLVQDECFDLELYRRFSTITKDEKLRTTFLHLISAETHHVAIWQKHFPNVKAELGLLNRVKLEILASLARIGGDVFMRIIVEAIEIHGVRKYMQVARLIDGTPMAEDLAGILRDELGHEEEVVAGDSRTHITGDRIRSFLFGFNDGLIELTGTLVGFTASLGDRPAILAAGLTVLAAGSFSMAAGAYASDHAEKEVGALEQAKERFLEHGEVHLPHNGASTLASSFIVGFAYILGGLAPLIPILFHATSLLWSVVAAVAVSAMVSYVIAFLSGMQIRRRLFMNLGIVAIAVGFGYVAGLLVENISHVI